MKTTTITTHEADDRLIRVMSNGNEVADVQFMQGTDKFALDMISDWKPNTELTQWLHTRGIAKQMPLDYDQLNKVIWIWFWLTNEDPKPTREIDGVKWYWHESDNLWYNSETLYVKEHLPSDDVVLKLPKEQRYIIMNALAFYRDCYRKFNEGKFNEVPNDKEDYEIFDIHTLIALMSYDLDVRIKGDDVDVFTARHGVDLPDYNN